MRLLVNLKMIEPSSQIVDLVMDSAVSHLDIISRPPVGMGVARRTRRGIVAVVVIHGHAVVIANSVGMGVTRRTRRGIVVAVTVDIHVGIRMTVRIRHFRCGIGVDACPLPVPRHIGITVRAVTGVVAPTLQPGTRIAARHITHTTTAMPGPVVRDVVRTSNRRGTRIPARGCQHWCHVIAQACQSHGASPGPPSGDADRWLPSEAANVEPCDVV